MTLEVPEFLDNDFYNFTMSEFIREHYPDVYVTYKFKNRSRLKIKEKVKFEELKERLFCLEEIKPTAEDISYLSSLNIFSSEFLKELMLVQMPKLQIFQGIDEYEIHYSGPWWESVFLETPILFTINELYTDFSLHIGTARYKNKIEALRLHPYLNFVEFGSRRRASKDWQDQVLEAVMHRRPYQVKGTSNVALAKKYNLAPVGTMAHQLFMVASALKAHDPAGAQIDIIDNWEDYFGEKNLLTALTDTFGTSFFLDHFSPAALSTWRGYRQDSGDPVAWGRQLLNTFSLWGVDPRSKVLTFSDGLDVQKMADIWGQLGHLANVQFGWGTNLTNDVGAPPLSIIVKPEMATRKGNTIVFNCVKLSDNIDKATGDAKLIEQYKEICGRTTFSEAPIY